MKYREGKLARANWDETGRRRNLPPRRLVNLVRWISVGEDVPLPRPRIQLVRGTVPQRCARNALPAQSGFLYRPAGGTLNPGFGPSVYWPLRV
jgi:hypothetical protein